MVLYHSYPTQQLTEEKLCGCDVELYKEFLATVTIGTFLVS